MKTASLNRIQKRTVFIFKNQKPVKYFSTGDPTTTLTITSTVTDPTNTNTSGIKF
jgi:hypothetical protein